MASPFPTTLSGHETKSGGTTVKGHIIRVAGPIIVADDMSGSGMNELVHIGKLKLVGEIIKLTGDTAAIQCYEDTAGLAIGDSVECTGEPLQVELGPGIMNTIFDGIQRPLDAIANSSDSVFVPRGVHVKSLDHTKIWEFIPADVQVGELVAGGFILGTVQENRLINHKIMVPPKVGGKLKSIVQRGKFTLDDTIAVLEDPSNSTNTINLRLSHYWPARIPRPVAERLAPNRPLLTGVRVLDSLFPLVLGGTCAVPGAFGCGKGVITQALAKYSNSQAIFYVGCGERGNEMAEVLMDFPELTLNVEDEQIPVMEHTCLIGNTSNMPLAAREACIYTGVTLAEYFRDMGYDVTMMADSTSRWAEAVREISNRLEEQTSYLGYPSYLGTRLAAFYERAGRVTCLGSPKREGSVTIVGTASPAGGDLSDPVVASTLGIVQVFWGLDKKIAQRKHFPSVNWFVSFSRYERALTAFFTEVDPDFLGHRTAARQLLQLEKDLAEIVQLVGKDCLADDQKLALEMARLVREDFLQQNMFSTYDHTCPIHKSAGMLRNFMKFYELAKKAVTTKQDPPITWDRIKKDMRAEYVGLVEMKFILPTLPKEEVVKKLDELYDKIRLGFQDFRIY